MWKNLVSSEAAKKMSASMQQATEAIAQKTAEAQDADTPLGKRISEGWGSVMQSAKHAVDETRKVVEKEQTRLFSSSKQAAPVRRDVRLPLDVDALRDAEVVYITERIITMSHPAMQSAVDEKITPNRKLAAVAHLLDRRHGGRYMVWNLSEVEYDIDMFDDQVLTFSFPGSPSPPLGLLLKLLMSMESWLKADERNVAVVHCLTGKGRTSTVLAAFLCWVGEAGFHNVQEALSYIAKCKKLTEEQLVIPSQRRYVKYFANMLDGVRPSQPPLMLKRVIMSEAPKFAKGPPLDDGNDNAATLVVEEASLMGCAPYLQIFKAGELVFTAAASINYQQEHDELPFCHVSQGPVSFTIEQVVQGDILVRCRHLTASGQRVSMFRAAFHTGYVPPKVMRLTKGQLDGACNDKRFVDDFFLDLIFEPCDAEMASEYLDAGKPPSSGGDDAVETAEARSGEKVSETTQGKGVGGGTIVTASAYDSMLHRDSRFWDVIAERREQHNHHEEENLMWGPTIGRKRDLSSKSKGFAEKTDEGKQTSADQQHKSSSLQAFSIGGDLDFFGPPEEATPPSTTNSTPKRSDAPPKRDELMEALMALDDEHTLSPPTSTHMAPTYNDISQAPPRNEIEEIVFEEASDIKPVATTTEEPHATIVELPPLKQQDTTAAAGVELEKSVEDTMPPPTEKSDSKETMPQEMPNEAVSAAVTTTTAETTTTSTATTNAVDEAADLLKDAELNVDDDLDALLASAGDDDDNVDNTEADLGDFFDFADDLDADLEDLENLLSQAK